MSENKFLTYGPADHLSAACIDIESAKAKMESVSIHFANARGLLANFSGSITSLEGILSGIQEQLTAIANDVDRVSMLESIGGQK